MEFHRVAYDARYLMETAIIALLHSVENAALHGLESVINMGNGSVEDYIRSIIQEPLTIHSGEFIFALSARHNLIKSVVFLNIIILFDNNVLVGFLVGIVLFGQEIILFYKVVCFICHI